MMLLPKADFIRQLQAHDAPLSAPEIVQSIRKAYYWISLHRGDNELKSETYRGYMVKPEIDPSISFSAEEPAVYWCVMALDQSQSWQNVIWIKEILQVIDSNNHCTNDRESLEAMLEMRVARSPNSSETPPNVVADKNGFILALGCAVPKAYRDTLRQTDALKRFGNDYLSEMINIPVEYVDGIISTEFEQEFDTALSQIEANL